jgi:hypothetical protein
MQDTETILEQWMPPLYGDPLVAAGGLEGWDANITPELGRLDGCLYQVQHDAQSRLWPHRGTLENLNRTVPEYEAQMQLAMRHVERSTAALQPVSTNAIRSNYCTPANCARTCWNSSKIDAAVRASPVASIVDSARFPVTSGSGRGPAQRESTMVVAACGFEAATRASRRCTCPF